MKFNEFVAYKDDCVVCGDKLDLYSIITCFIIGDNGVISLAGNITYKFQEKNNIFLKHQVPIFSEYGHGKLQIYSIFESAPKSFSINRYVYPRFNKLKIQKALKPGFALNAMELLYKKVCKNNHYEYVSDTFYDRGGVGHLSIDYEEVKVHSHIISNIFFWNKLIGTNVYRWIGSSNKISNIPLPPIPLNRWKFESEIDFKNQVDKYLTLT